MKIVYRIALILLSVSFLNSCGSSGHSPWHQNISADEFFRTHYEENELRGVCFNGDPPRRY